ncbi:MAG: hypothetical protein AAGA60_07350 [Cyanobacteria bacterium P01_E01_bin.42]
MIIDTSILCVWLQVPEKETCGSDKNKWDKERVDPILNEDRLKKEKITCVLPLAVIIETGNHIAQAETNQRYEIAQKLAELMKKTADNTTPWAAFTQQAELWDAEKLKQLAEEFPQFATQSLAFGDLTIKKVADFYAQLGSEVEILTGDRGLKSHEPPKPTLIPRRRQKKKS